MPCPWSCGCRPHGWGCGSSRWRCRSSTSTSGGRSAGRWIMRQRGWRSIAACWIGPPPRPGDCPNFRPTKMGLSPSEVRGPACLPPARTAHCWSSRRRKTSQPWWPRMFASEIGIIMISAGGRWPSCAFRPGTELLAEARRWTAAYRPPAAQGHDPRGPIFLAGHQPELFHPGVWLKNFALGALARRHGATAVNLVIDSDTVKSTSLAVPGGTVADARLRVDAAGQPGARSALRRAAGRRPGVVRRFRPPRGRADGRPGARPAGPPDYWPLVLQRSEAGDRLGYCLAQARHQLEGRWGLQTLEVPQSWVCECEPFRWFAVHLLAQAPRFRKVYNEGGGGVSAGPRHPQRGPAGARPGRGRPVAGGAAVDLDGRASRAAAVVRLGVGRRTGHFGSARVWNSACRWEHTATRPRWSSNWPKRAGRG